MEAVSTLSLSASGRRKERMEGDEDGSGPVDLQNVFAELLRLAKAEMNAKLGQHSEDYPENASEHSEIEGESLELSRLANAENRQQSGSEDNAENDLQMEFVNLLTLARAEVQNSENEEDGKRDCVCLKGDILFASSRGSDLEYIVPRSRDEFVGFGRKRRSHRA